MSAKNPRVNPEDVATLRALLDPAKIVHEDARSGSESLLLLEDENLYAIFEDICVRGNRLVLKVAEKYLPSGALTEETSHIYTAALRRLSIVGESLAARIKRRREAKAAEEKQSMRAELVKLDINPGMQLSEHINKAKKAGKDIDCVQKMAGVVTLLENQLETLYTYPTRQAQPFMGVGQVNMVANTYMSALSQLHRMQVDVGIVEKQPEKMEVNLRNAGAFQTYLGELSQDRKQSMTDFADSFCKLVVEKLQGGNADNQQ